MAHGSIEIGYALSSEEHPPTRLVQLARSAEQAGFDFALISDHFHPWIERQGNSPFVWSVLGAIAQVTENLRLGTGVTCPLIRIHPAVIAQAAATVAAMMPERFFLGVGTGENLNEHIIGLRWPPPAVRLEMLKEAIEVIRMLWQGGEQNHHGRYYTVEGARLYSLPPAPPPLYVAASESEAAELAGHQGDGLITTSPDDKVLRTFAAAGGKRKPRYGQITVCWAEDEQQAVRTAHEIWPNTALPGTLFTELPLPRHFEKAAELVKEEDIAKDVVCGNQLDRYLEQIDSYARAGIDHIYLHQIGPDQEGFFRFFQSRLGPAIHDRQNWNHEARRRKSA